MSDASTVSTHFVTTCTTMLQHATRQRRTALRVLVLTIGLVLVTGRAMVSRLLMVTGMATGDWTAAYRVFAQGRIDITDLWQQVTTAWLGLYNDDAPVVVVVDGTQLPRTGRKIPGAGFARAPRTPAWKPGIHHAQRWVGVSGLTPPTVSGDCRTVPLWFMPAPPPTARAWPGHSPMTEWQAGVDGVQWIRDMTGSSRPLVAVGDGGYSGAGVWNTLPANTTMIARCARNRAVFALPDPDEPPRRGRKRLYGERGLSPQEQGQIRHGWQRCDIVVRGKTRHLRLRVSGPWVIKKAPDHPLMLITIGGIGRTVGKTRRARDMMHFLVNARQTDTGWELPYPLTDLAMWVWQRWEVEVMHRELKSGWGLGDQQQWSPVAAATVTQWVIWAYAVLILTGVTHPPSVRHTRRWYCSRRWTPRDLTLILRQELWCQPPRELTAVQPWFTAKPSQNTALRVLLAVADAI